MIEAIKEEPVVPAGRLSLAVWGTLADTAVIYRDEKGNYWLGEKPLDYMPFSKVAAMVAEFECRENGMWESGEQQRFFYDEMIFALAIAEGKGAQAA